jgi:hypothetical protein
MYINMYLYLPYSKHCPNSLLIHSTPAIQSYLKVEAYPRLSRLGFIIIYDTSKQAPPLLSRVDNI